MLRIWLEGALEAVEPTRWHRLYSETAGAWVAAGELKAGDWLRTADGARRIERIEARPGIHRVYNLEVDTDHCYYVSRDNVLSHNVNPCGVTYKSYLNPDPFMDIPPVRYKPTSIDEVIKMRQGKGPRTKSVYGPENIEAHHRNQIPINEGGVIDEITEFMHRRGGNHTRHIAPSILTPQQRIKEIRNHWLARGAEYILPGEGI